MKHSLLLLTLIGSIALAACERPKETVVIVVPGRAGSAGATGDTGNRGATGNEGV
jgi:hypothetical protein